MDVEKELQSELDISSGLILASEPWSKQYQKDTQSFLKLTTTEARLQRKLRSCLKDFSERARFVINWGEWQRIRAYDVEVLVNQDEIDNQAGLIAKIIFDDLTIATALGAQSGEAVYNIPLGLTSTDAVIQELTTKQVAYLVGKKVKDGIIVDNPTAKYRITDKLRADIANAIKTSANMRENEYETTSRVANAIKNPKRAEIIAQTETVNAYQNGLLEFGRQSGAVGKEWLSINKVDICGIFAKDGIVDLSHMFELPNGLKVKGPAAHPRCRCSLRLVYPNELS